MLCRHLSTSRSGNSPEKHLVVGHREAELLEVVRALRTGGRPRRGRWRAGSRRAMSTAMIAIATRGSINVKPARTRGL